MDREEDLVHLFTSVAHVILGRGGVKRPSKAQSVLESQCVTVCVRLERCIYISGETTDNVERTTLLFMNSGATSVTQFTRNKMLCGTVTRR